MITDHLEMIVSLAISRVVSRTVSPARSLWLGRQIAETLSLLAPAVPEEGAPRGGRAIDHQQRAERLVWRAARLPWFAKADCYDRALAVRWWLAKRGVASQVVFGLRKEHGAWEGHAWLELGDGSKLFVEESLGYREIAREADEANLSGGSADGASVREGDFGVAVEGVIIAAMGGRNPSSVAQVMARGAELGLAPLLYRMAPTLGLELPPTEKLAWRAHLADVLLRRRAMLEVLEHLQHRDVLVLKGEALAQRLFKGDGLARRSSDIDLLVRLSEVEAIASELSQVGYRPLHHHKPEPWRYNQWAFVHERSGQVLELHWALAAPEVCQPDPEALFECAHELSFHGHVIRVLDPVHTFLHLCLHFHNHVGFFKGLVDVAAWLDAYHEHPDLLEAALAKARAIGMEQICMWPLRTIARTGIASLWTAWHMDRVLVRSSKITGASALAFKTQDVLQVEVGLWRMLGMVLLDEPGDVARALAELVFLGPRAMARERVSVDGEAYTGDAEVTWEDYWAVAARMPRIAVRIIREVRGEDGVARSESP